MQFVIPEEGIWAICDDTVCSGRIALVLKASYIGWGRAVEVGGGVGVDVHELVTLVSVFMDDD